MIRSERRYRRRLGLLGRVVFAVLLGAFVLAPLVGVVSTSVDNGQFWEFPPRGFTLRWYQAFFASPDLVQSAIVSVEAAAMVGVLGTLVATLTGLALTRSRIGKTARDLINVAILIPLLVPTIALGLSIYTLYIQAQVPVNVVTLALAQIILALPLITGLLVIGFGSIRPNVERAAANLGARPLQLFLRVTLPLLRPVLIASAIVAFVRSFDDSSVALFLTSPTTIALPVRMLLEMEHESGPLIAAAGSVLLIIAVILATILDRTVGLARAFGLGEVRER